MTPEIQLGILMFIGSSSLVVLIFSLVAGHNRRLAERLRDEASPTVPQTGIFSQLTQSTLPRMGSALLPRTEEQQGYLKARLTHAGFYNRSALSLFLGVKMLLIVVPFIAAVFAILFGVFPPVRGLCYGLVGSAAGIILPGLWLDSRKARRQLVFRRGLPDAFDMLGLSLEGGMSLPAALELVVTELRGVHPELAEEMDIVQREIQLGRTTGEALSNLGQRTDLDEVRSLASAVLQSERLGSGLVKTLRVNADTLRMRRIQKAEERAQKAGTKIVFPTILCIFPSMFLVVLGPSVIHIMKMLAKTG